MGLPFPFLNKQVMFKQKEFTLHTAAPASEYNIKVMIFDTKIHKTRHRHYLIWFSSGTKPN